MQSLTSSLYLLYCTSPHVSPRLPYSSCQRHTWKVRELLCPQQQTSCFSSRLDSMNTVINLTRSCGYLRWTFGKILKDIVMLQYLVIICKWQRRWIFLHVYLRCPGSLEIYTLLNKAFVEDDWVEIVNNPRIQKNSLFWVCAYFIYANLALL